jgi:hypothetical protein
MERQAGEIWMRQHGKAAAGRAPRHGQRHVVVACTPVSSVQVDSAFFARGMEASLRRDDCRAGQKTTRRVTEKQQDVPCCI